MTDSFEIGRDNTAIAERSRTLTELLVGWPSETGSVGEAEFAERLAGLLRGIPYFEARPGNIAVVPSHGTPLRSSVAALVRGRGRACVLLVGHFDTVAVENYGSLVPLSRSPDPLRQALIDELQTRPREQAEQHALDDLLGGDFLPGRGMLDMKSGLAAGITVLERFAARDGFNGNVLFLAAPDEESRSRGIRTLRDALPGLLQRWDLEPVAALNLDSSTDNSDGSYGQTIFFGTNGKLLPFAFVVGREAHASYPFDGVSAHLIGAEIMRAVEANVSFCDEGDGALAAPPVCLEAKDLRDDYDVTTPGCTWLAFNWMVRGRSAEASLDLFRKAVEGATAEALLRFTEEKARFLATRGETAKAEPAARVLTLAELKEEAAKVGGPEARDRFDRLAASLEGTSNPLVVTRKLVRHLVAEAQLGGPAVVVGFGSLHYPATTVGEMLDSDRWFRRTLAEAAAAASQAYETTITLGGRFTGISDMSFIGHRPEARAADFVAANTVAPAHIDAVSQEVPTFPVANIGPWGRAVHQKLERVYAPYAFNVLPDLVFEATRRLLSA